MVPRDDRTVAGERRDLLEPDGVVAPRPVTQDEGNLTLADHLVVQPLPVVVHEAGATYGQ